jgi:hypothetical protein
MMLWEIDLKKSDVRMSTRFTWVWDGDQYQGCCEHSNNIRVSEKREFFDLVNEL